MKEITSIYNSRKNQYLDWLDRHITIVETNLENIKGYKSTYSLCNNVNYYDCLKFHQILGKGGGASVLLASFPKGGENCNHLFNVSPHYRFALKLCLYDVFYNEVSCFGSELPNLLKYSKLYSQRFCLNFNYCLGYGIKCNLLVSNQEAKNINEGKKSETDLKNFHIIKTLLPDDDDRKEYIQEFADDNCRGCDNFILMNLVDGKDLLKITTDATDKDFNPNLQLTDRQIFELFYSLLCSIYHYKQIPADRHLDNYMLNQTDKGVVIQINDQTLYFESTISFFHLDYQVMKDTDRLIWSDVSEIVDTFVPEKWHQILRQFIDLNLDPRESINRLPLIFNRARISPEKLKTLDQNNTDFLVFREIL